MKYGYLMAAACAASLALGASPLASAQTADAKDAGSFYLQCDGQPNNMTTGEGVARFLGAVTLLGLFAPPPEAADASKRKFGADGVAACTAVLDGAKAEGNPRRRIPLILARALHQIEAKNLDAAIADVGKARAEADAAKLTSDPYFNRSMGLSFDQIEAAALVRQGKVEEAHRLSLSDTAQHRFSLLPLIRMRAYSELAPIGNDADLERARAIARLMPIMTDIAANRLEELGRFDESVAMRADFVAYQARLKDKDGAAIPPNTLAVAQLALAEALAGQWDSAAANAARARTIDDKRLSDGKPEEMDVRLQASEVLDLYEVLQLARQGNTDGARRKFTARTRWLAPSFGAVLAVNRRLYDGAAAADRIGPLALPADAQWEERAASSRAELLAKDSDNKTLFSLIKPYVSAGAFEAQSRSVWQTDKSKIFIKRKTSENDDGSKIAFIYGGATDAAYDAMLLHAALDAKARGQKDFTFSPILQNYTAAIVRPATLPDGNTLSSLAFDPDAVIAALSPVIPDPVTLKARRAAAGR